MKTFNEKQLPNIDLKNLHFWDEEKIQMKKRFKMNITMYFYSNFARKNDF